MTEDNAEAAVQDYLRFIRDPDSLRDEVAVTAAEQAVEAAQAAGDVLAEARARADRLAADSVDEAAVRAAFLEHAKRWADAEAIPTRVLLDMGVGPDVLREAGFDVRVWRESNGATSRRKSSGRRVSGDEVRADIRGRTATFSLKMVADSTGASTQTVRSIVSELVDGGEVTDEGPDPDHRARGRAPTLYKLVRTA